MTRLKTALTALAFTALSATTAHAGAAADAAKKFFDEYRAQNVPGMVALFQPKGTVEYVPFKLQGPVEKIGPGSWGVLIEAFPNLSNKVHSITESADGRTAHVDVNISGTQTKDVFGVPNKGKSYDLRHMFIIRVDQNGKITNVTSFWDNADWYVQLGKKTL
ncbi:MAG: ester cyclase [Pseudomonadota bacterium]